jgi:Lon protease-like protein
MSRGSSLPSQIPILPLLEQHVLFPGLLLRLRITHQTSTALLSHILHSDQTTLLNLVLGCVPVRAGSGIAGIIGEDAASPRSVLPTPESLPTRVEEAKETSKSFNSEFEFGCTARIKDLRNLDRSYGTTEFVLVVQGIALITIPYLHSGISRFRIDKITQKHPYIEALVTHFPDKALPIAATPLLSQLKNTAMDLVRQMTPATAAPKTFPLMRLENYISRADRGDAGQLADLCVVAFEGGWEDKLVVLGATDVKTRVEKVLEILTSQLGILQVSKKVNQNVGNKLTKQQRE